jgi:hypothetical protein
MKDSKQEILSSWIQNPVNSLKRRMVRTKPTQKAEVDQKTGPKPAISKFGQTSQRKNRQEKQDSLIKERPTKVKVKKSEVLKLPQRDSQKSHPLPSSTSTTR